MVALSPDLLPAMHVQGKGRHSVEEANPAWAHFERKYGI